MVYRNIGGLVTARSYIHIQQYEKEILRDTAKTLKASLREHSSIRTEENVI